jgi:hypothetical protein
MEQLKANELRIGNFVLDDTSDNVMIVSRIENKDYTEWNSGDKYNIYCLKFGTKGYYEGNFKPIPLTKEWLKKFGFKKERGESYKLGKYQLYYLLYYEGYKVGELTIKYVHQLQNIYFASSGEELTIKEL